MSDTKETIKCPACGKEMKKVFIKDKGFYLDICIDGCGGILFDNREFKRFDEQNEPIDDILNAYSDKKYKPCNEHEERICPVCLQPMVKNFASSLKEVQIDECYSCGAKFLDYGELEKIRNQFKTEADRREKFNADLKKEFDEILTQEQYEHTVLNNSFIVSILNKLTQSRK